MKTTPVHLPDEANLALEQLALQTGRSQVEMVQEGRSPEAIMMSPSRYI
ncbi:MAG: hypothetical protein HC879_10840 [Leptolyngbyaceae cyanobacterium SL_5_9]|nr:hypothetical protein [Leptolyngbyaceae cyanobacterium SL_5_9]NJO73936.1 hypothetical protein [Leptolyngbyaceae cyanobacterium RM1_406_9]